MANEVTISVGARANEEQVKSAAQTFFSIYSKTFAKLRAESAIDIQNIKAPQKNANFGERLEKEKKAAEGVASALGEVSDAASEVSTQIGKLQRLLEGLSSAFKADKLKAGLATIGIAVLSVLKAYQEWREERKRLNFEARQKDLEDAETRINRVYEERLNLLKRTADLQANARDNARAEADAVNMMAEATIKIAAAKGRMVAISDQEKNNLENQLKKTEDIMEKQKKLEDIRRKQEDLEVSKEVATEERAEKERELKRVSKEKEDASKQEKKWDALYEGGKNKTVTMKEIRQRDTPINRIMPNSIPQSKLVSQEQAQREYEAARQRRKEFESKEATLKEELKDIDTRIAKIDQDLGSKKFTLEKKALEKRFEQYEAELEASKAEQDRQTERANRQRFYTESDRARSEQDARDEAAMTEAAMLSGGDYDTQMANLGKTTKKAETRKAIAEANLRKAEQEELDRINSVRRSQGLTALTSLSQVDETGLSEDFKEKRSREEGRIQEENGRLIELKRQKRELRFKGRETTEKESRNRELDDRKRENEIAEEEEQDRRLEQYGGHAMQLGVQQAKLKRSETRQQQYQSELEQAQKDELKRVNEDRKARGLSALTDFGQIDRHALSGAYKDTESRYEGLIQGEVATQRGIKGRIYDLEREGDAKTAELRAQSLKGGSRLTAMGLGGGDSPQKETAKHTRSMDQKLSKMISLLEPGELRFEKNPRSGKWGML